jgi:hypothetical protein
MHALRDQFLLQLDQVPTQLFVIPPTIRDLCQRLLGPPPPVAPLHQALGKLLQGVRGLTVHPCVKGRLFEAMTRKLEQLRGGSSNEVTTVDFAQITASLLGDGSDEAGSC